MIQPADLVVQKPQGDDSSSDGCGDGSTSNGGFANELLTQ